MKPHLKLCIAITICCAGLSTFAQGGPPFQLTDNFANRPVIFGPDYWITGSLSNTTSEAGEPLIDGVSSGQTVWGSWTAPSNGLVTLSANATNFSPLLAVFTGNNLANLSLFTTLFSGGLGLLILFLYLKPPQVRSPASQVIAKATLAPAHGL